MSNLITAARQEIDALISRAYDKAVAAGELPEGATISGSIEIPREGKNGDWAASHALAGAKALHKAPKVIAEILQKNLDLNNSFFREVEIAGPGFLNFWVSDRWYAAVIEDIDSEGTNFGHVDIFSGDKIMVEFVSANPTGPMTIGNARGGVLGDSLAEILSRAGANVTREFYVNDAGNQVDLFARSLEARYLQLLQGEDSVTFPEDGYHGEDIRELARLIIERDGDRYLHVDSEERLKVFCEFGLSHNIALMRDHLDQYRISFDSWFLESTLHESGYIEESVRLLTENGLTYEKDGALWLKNIELGGDKDEVLRRANGFYTYYASDIAYHRNKFSARGFDRVIDVWGADHHGHAVRFAATMNAPCLEMSAKKLDFLIMQMVRLTRDGETVKVSKRTGKALTLFDLMDEIGVDACRFFFNAKPDTHLEFDLDLAVRQDSENPVYYVQYAHARISSLIANLEAEGQRVPCIAEVEARLLSTESERDLIKQLSMLPEEIRLAATSLDPSRINRYATELATRFHKFYTVCRVKGETEELLKARLKLVDSTREVLAIALGIIGVDAPKKM